MNPRRVITAGILIALALALVCILSPPPFAGFYASAVPPVSLFVGGIMAARVAKNYRKELRYSLITLSAFLILYMLSNLRLFWDIAESLTKNNIALFILAYQTLDYGLLIASSIFTLKVVEVKKLSRFGWGLVAVMFPFCVYAVISDVTADAGMSLPVISALLVRVFDMSIILMLIPVIVLYVQHLRLRAQESTSFTLIMGGVIFSLISTYIFQMTLGISSENLATYFQTGSLLDAAYIFGYTVIALGLYVQMRYDEWGFGIIDKALG